MAVFAFDPVTQQPLLQEKDNSVLFAHLAVLAKEDPSRPADGASIYHGMLAWIRRAQGDLDALAECLDWIIAEQEEGPRLKLLPVSATNGKAAAGIAAGMGPGIDMHRARTLAGQRQSQFAVAIAASIASTDRLRRLMSLLAPRNCRMVGREGSGVLLDIGTGRPFIVKVVAEDGGDVLRVEPKLEKHLVCSLSSGGEIVEDDALDGAIESVRGAEVLAKLAEESLPEDRPFLSADNNTLYMTLDGQTVCFGLATGKRRACPIVQQLKHAFVETKGRSVSWNECRPRLTQQ